MYEKILVVLEDVGIWNVCTIVNRSGAGMFNSLLLFHFCIFIMFVVRNISVRYISPVVKKNNSETTSINVLTLNHRRLKFDP